MNWFENIFSGVSKEHYLELRNDFEKLEVVKRRQSAELERVKKAWAKDLNKFNSTVKNYDIQQKGYHRMRTRNYRARCLLKEMESQTKGGWKDYNTCFINGYDLVKLNETLDGRNENGSKKTN